MSDDALIADANLAEIARLRTAVRDLREINAQAKREIDAERAARRAFEADAAQLRAAARAFIHAGSYVERFKARAELEVLAAVEHPGVLLLKELEAARAIVELARNSYDVQDYPAEEGDLYKAIAAYDAIVKGSSE